MNAKTCTCCKGKGRYAVAPQLAYKALFRGIPRQFLAGYLTLGCISLSLASYPLILGSTTLLPRACRLIVFIYFDAPSWMYGMFKGI